jgi:hypothetical protein
MAWYFIKHKGTFAVLCTTLSLYRYDSFIIDGHLYFGGTGRHQVSGWLSAE